MKGNRSACVCVCVCVCVCSPNPFSLCVCGGGGVISFLGSLQGCGQWKEEKLKVTECLIVAVWA